MYYTRKSDNLELSAAILAAILDIFQIGNLMVKIDSTPQQTLITMYYKRKSVNLEFSAAILDIFYVPA